MLVLLAVAAAIVPDAASACSCMPTDAGEHLRDGKPAVIATVTEKHRVGEVAEPSFGIDYDYTLRIERPFNLEPLPTMVLRATDNGAMCGVDWSVGKRIAVLLHRRDDGTLTAGLCSMVEEAALIAAADGASELPGSEPPPTGGRPPAVGPKGAPMWFVARRGAEVVAPGGRRSTSLDELAVKPGKAIRIRLGAAAKSVKAALANASGKRVGPMRPARVLTRTSRRTWLVRIPRAVPRGADRLLVTVDDGTVRTRAAVGLAFDCPLR